MLNFSTKPISLGRIKDILIIVVCLVAVIYFGIQIFSSIRPKTLEEQKLHCLELGSNDRSSACLRLLPNDQPDCSFQLSGIKDYKGTFDEGYSYYHDYEGVIKNTSNRQENLKALLVKLYTKDKLLVGEGYSGIGTTLNSGASLPFKVNVRSREDSIVSANNPDIYPWFTTCK